jgi:hypothetical protein
MGIEVVLTFVVAGGLALAIGRLLFWRPLQFRARCPACHGILKMTGAMAATRVNGFGKRFPSSWLEYRCKSCSAEFVEQDRKGMVARADWEASRQAPIPGARIVE